MLREIGGHDADGQGLPSYDALTDDGTHPMRVLDPCRDLRRRRQPGRPPPARRRAELDRPGVGLGVAEEHPHALQPRLGRSRGPSVVRAQALPVVGRASRGSGPASATRRTSRPTRRPDYRPPEGANGPGRDLAATRRSCSSPTAARWMYVPDRPGRRPAAGPLRAPRDAAPQSARRPAEQSDPPAVRAPGERSITRASPDERVFPYVLTHLPADRAPHRRGHVARRCRSSPSCSPSSSARSHRRWPPNGAWSTVAGRRSSPRARRSRRG